MELSKIFIKFFKIISEKLKKFYEFLAYILNSFGATSVVLSQFYIYLDNLGMYKFLEENETIKNSIKRLG